MNTTALTAYLVELHNYLRELCSLPPDLCVTGEVKGESRLMFLNFKHIFFAPFVLFYCTHLFQVYFIIIFTIHSVVFNDILEGDNVQIV